MTASASERESLPAEKARRVRGNVRALVHRRLCVAEIQHKGAREDRLRQQDSAVTADFDRVLARIGFRCAVYGYDRFVENASVRSRHGGEARRIGLDFGERSAGFRTDKFFTNRECVAAGNPDDGNPSLSARRGNRGDGRFKQGIHQKLSFHWAYTLFSTKNGTRRVSGSGKCGESRRFYC